MTQRQYNDSGYRNFDTAEIIPKHRLVKYGSGLTITMADLGEEAIGSSVADAFTSGDNIGVAMITKPGTVVLEAAGAFAAGAVLYGQADGKVDDVATSAVRIGIALEAAAADGDYAEVMIDKGA